MWLWGKKDKADIQGHMTVKAGGTKYTIRRLNPLIDFPADRMPQIFSTEASRRKVEPKAITPSDEARAMRDMMAIVEAGIVGIQDGRGLLPLVPVGRGDKHTREAGITVEDLFRDQDVGAKLYWDIMTHSLNRFKCLKKVFFYLKIRFLRFIISRSVMGRLQMISPSPTVASV